MTHAPLPPAAPADEVDHESGFTLPELLVSITIMMLVIGVLSLAITTGLRSLTQAKDRTLGTVQSEILTALFPQDVNGAAGVLTGANASVPSNCGTGTPVAVMQGKDSSGSRFTRLWYALDGKGNLLRYTCGTNGVDKKTTVLQGITGTTTVVCQTPTAATPYISTGSDCSSTSHRVRVGLAATTTAVSGANGPLSFTIYGYLS